MSDFESSLYSEIVSEQNTKVEKPRMFRVIMHNDNYTTMEFVVDVLKSIFRKSENEATAIMLDIHKKGMGICGVYILDVALTKAEQVGIRAEESGFPLQCTCEEA